MRVEACGVCHSDSLTVEGDMPGIEYPRVPAHEIAGRIEAVGDDTFPWEVRRESGARPGDLVAVLGIGGLGHLGVQFARHMGFETVAIARGTDRRNRPARSARTTTSTPPAPTPPRPCSPSAA